MRTRLNRPAAAAVIMAAAALFYWVMISFLSNSVSTMETKEAAVVSIAADSEAATAFRELRLSLVQNSGNGSGGGFPATHLLEHSDVEGFLLAAKGVSSGVEAPWLGLRWGPSRHRSLEVLPLAFRSWRFVVQQFNPVRRLTRPELEGVLSGRISLWNRVGGEGLPIRVILPQGAEAEAVLAEAGLELMEPVAVERRPLGEIPGLVSRDPTALALLPVDSLWAGTRPVAVEENGQGTYRSTLNILRRKPGLLRRAIRALGMGGKDSSERFWRQVGNSPSAVLDRRPPGLTMAAVGDVMLAREITPLGRQKGYRYFFEGTASLLRGADLAFANLESPMGTTGIPYNLFRAEPQAMDGLLHAGFDVVSLANNHILDYGYSVLNETLALLDGKGIKRVGAGRSLGEARKPALFELKGIKTAFLAYTETWFIDSSGQGDWVAGPGSAGVAPAREAYVREDVARAAKVADLVVVSFHWGDELEYRPSSSQVRLARTAVDAGADLVLGHHPHVLQGIEFYKGAVIAYSLGNFVFELRNPQTKRTIILMAEMSREGIRRIELVPVYIDAWRPVPLDGGRGLNLRLFMDVLSRELALK